MTLGVRHSQNEEAAAAAAGNIDNDRELDANLAESDFADLLDGGPDHDWSVGYDPALEGKMEQFKTDFYHKQTEAQCSGSGFLSHNESSGPSCHG